MAEFDRSHAGAGVPWSTVAAGFEAPPGSPAHATVRLALPKSETVEKNIARYKNMPLEKQALQLIKEAYGGAFPSSYQVTDKATPVSLCPDLDLVQQQIIEVEGVGLRLKTFKATSRLTSEIDLEEKTFLSSAVGNPILAVAVEQHTLKPKQSTRVFGVEKKDALQGPMTSMESGAER